MLEFDVVQSGLVLLLLMLGEWLSRRCGGVVPGVLLAGMLFAGGCWSGLLPRDLTNLAGFSALTPAAMMMVIASMGASMNLRQFAANWRVVALAAATYAGQVLAILCVVGTVCGLPTAIGGLPGGMATALIVQERARSLGMNQVVMLSVLLLTTQALIGCPVAAACIRREARRLDSLPAPAASAAADAAEAKLRKAQFGSLLRLYAVAWAATRLEQLTGLSRYVLCLLLGLALAAVGWLDRAELASSKSDGFFFFLLIGSVLSGFAAAEPAMFGQMLPVLLLVLAVSALSAMAISQLLGRLLGFSGAMAMALSMNVMVGFPMNMLISQEIIEHLTADPEKRQYLMEEIAARMVLGGMVTTTFLATAAAGLLVPLMG